MHDDAIRLAGMLRRVARGRHGHEHLTMDEARSALATLLEADADPLQLGAFLIAERMKGETAAELAGFVQAARAHISGFGEADLADGVDLPCYAGKRRAAPVHLAAALQARDAGLRILVHGVAQIDGRLSAWQALKAAGVSRAASLAEAASLIESQGIAYLDLAELCPPLHRIYGLRPRLGVRSFANSVARLLNPLACSGQLNGVFHTPYVDKMAQANVLLGQPRSLVFMGAEGEPELYADRQKRVAMQRGSEVHAAELADMRSASYPRDRQSPATVATRFASILQGERDGREAATLMRMEAALRWAAGGDWPADWHIPEA
jgi:anthranilate phosphoribosyltransferase